MSRSLDPCSASIQLYIRAWFSQTTQFQLFLYCCTFQLLGLDPLLDWYDVMPQLAFSEEFLKTFSIQICTWKVELAWLMRSLSGFSWVVKSFHLTASWNAVARFSFNNFGAWLKISSVRFSSVSFVGPSSFRSISNSSDSNRGVYFHSDISQVFGKLTLKFELLSRSALSSFSRWSRARRASFGNPEE